MENKTATETKEAFNFRKYQSGWDSQNTKKVGLKFNRRSDADIITMLESVPNIQGYLKQLIRDDIARHAQEETPNDQEV